MGFPLSWVRTACTLCPSLYRRIRYESCVEPEVCQHGERLIDSVASLPGDVIECGCYVGGTTVMWSRHLQAVSPQKKYYALDTFEGFEAGEFSKIKDAGGVDQKHTGFNRNNLAYVRRKLRRLKIANVILCPGLFQDILPSQQTPLSFAFIDCDLHDSLLFALESVWPRLTAGGWVMCHDYSGKDFPGAREAVDEWLREHTSATSNHYFVPPNAYAICKAKG